MVLIAPSILSADFSRLDAEIEALDKAGADYIHLDVMDGRFVPNFTFGAPLIRQVRSASKLPFDVHLMITEPDKQLGAFAAAGADILTVHFEACPKLEPIINQIHLLGLKAGVSLKPKTPPEVLNSVLDKLDQVLVMTVEPGFGGQTFMQDQLPKIAWLKEHTKGKNIKIEVDGGINPQTAVLCRAQGADILVAGTAVFKDKNYRANMDALR